MAGLGFVCDDLGTRPARALRQVAIRAIGIDQWQQRVHAPVIALGIIRVDKGGHTDLRGGAPHRRIARDQPQVAALELRLPLQQA